MEVFKAHTAFCSFVKAALLKFFKCCFIKKTAYWSFVIVDCHLLVLYQSSCLNCCRVLLPYLFLSYFIAELKNAKIYFVLGKCILWTRAIFLLLNYMCSIKIARNNYHIEMSSFIFSTGLLWQNWIGLNRSRMKSLMKRLCKTRIIKGFDGHNLVLQKKSSSIWLQKLLAHN